MPRKKVFANSNERLKAHRLKKKGIDYEIKEGFVITNGNVSPPKETKRNETIPEKSSESSVDIMSVYKKLGINKDEKTLKGFIKRITELESLEAKRMLSKLTLDEREDNNTKYIDRIVNDVIRCMRDIKWIT